MLPILASVLAFRAGLAGDPPAPPPGAPSPGTGARSAWIRPQGAEGPLIWGRRDGIVFGLPSPGGLRGPRGLIRVGVFDGSSDRPLLINFIAFEPVVGGKKGFSELERSRLDGVRGKRLWVEGPAAGTLSTEGGAEELRVAVDCEDFLNGARVSAELRVRSDRPEEVLFSVKAREGSATLEQATLTATMGNYERLRRLWLKDRVVSSEDLYLGYSGKDFVEKAPYPLGDLARSANGDLWAAASSDEEDPAAATVPGLPSWKYRGPPLTQYWRVPRGDVEADLAVRVNGRRTYWTTDREIPGGLAFENFEVRQRYRPGQRSCFGLTRLRPGELEPWRHPGPGSEK